MRDFMTSIIPTVVTLTLAAFGFVFGYGRMSQRLTGVESTLYDGDGDCKLVAVNDFQDAQTRTCQKIDEVKSMVKEGDRKRDGARTENQKQLQEIARFMGSVEQWMKDHE